MKLNVVLDACSYIYLHQSQFTISGKQKTLFAFFKDFVNLYQSQIVNSEISRNFRQGEKVIIRERRNHRFRKRKFKLDDYDSKLFEGEIKSKSKDAGEKANLAVSIDLFHNEGKVGLIFLSDDKKAISENSSLSNIFNSFPCFPIWKSFEVVLFLYFTGFKKGFSYDIAKHVISDLVNFQFTIPREQVISLKGKISNDEYSLKTQTLKEKAIKQKTSYFQKLDIIRKLIEI